MDTSKRRLLSPKKEKISTKKNGLTAPKKLLILITIVERNKAEYYLDLIEGFEVNLQTVIFGKGTAPSEVQQYLGLASHNKAIIISIIKEECLKKCLITLEEKFKILKHGKGIAYTIPIDTTIGVLIYRFLSNDIEH